MPITQQTADQAQIYRTLERLERAGLATVRRARQAGRPDRRIHEITDAGRLSLTAWLSTVPDLAARRDPLLSRLWFARTLGDDDVLALLEGVRLQHQDRLNELRTRASAAATDHGTRTDHLRWMALNGAISEQRALVDWFDDCIETVKEGSLPPLDESDGVPTQASAWTGA
jgi:DNA-binding PadR family transcriptional regulator